MQQAPPGPRKAAATGPPGCAKRAAGLGTRGVEGAKVGAVGHADARGEQARAQMMVLVVNMKVRKGWLEFLGHVRLRDDLAFDRQERNLP